VIGRSGATKRASELRTDVPLIAQAIRRYRLAAGFSQSKLATKARLDHSYVSRLEHGDRMPSREALGRIADVLGLDAEARDELLLAAGFAVIASPLLAALNQAMRSCDEPARYALGEQVLLTACAIFRGEAA